MKKLILLVFVTLVATGVAMAQSNPSAGVYSGPTPAAGTLPYGVSNPTGFNAALSQDVLGAHNGYGRGCVMCHAPHGGALGNNAPSALVAIPNPAYGFANANQDTLNGSIALWGENLAPFYGATVQFVSGTTVVLPSSAADTSEGSGATTILLCLSCHDGALTRVAMMKGTTVEALPIVGGTAPTLFGTTVGNSAVKYINEHPVGVSVGCGAPHNWDCSGGGTGGTQITVTASSNMDAFAISNYPASLWYNYFSTGGASGYPLTTFGVSTGGAGNTYTVNGVTCTTCHNQHSMTVYSNNSGTYPTMFFIKGEYMPSTGGNSVAQFCRNCHGGESNEMAGLKSVPTT